MSDKESHVTKSDLTILEGVNRTEDLPSNRQVRFTPNRLYDLPPLKSSNFEQNFQRTQHHALLHKGLFCERPIILTETQHDQCVERGVVSLFSISALLHSHR